MRLDTDKRSQTDGAVQKAKKKTGKIYKNRLQKKSK